MTTIDHSPPPVTTPLVNRRQHQGPAYIRSSAPYVAAARRIRIEVVGSDAPRWLDDIEARLNSLLDLRHDWDTYGAKPINEANLMQAVVLLGQLVDMTGGWVSAPTAVPTADQGIQFEWEVGDACIGLGAGNSGRHVFIDTPQASAEGPATPALIRDAADAIARLPSVA